MMDRTPFLEMLASGEMVGLDPRSAGKKLLQVLGHPESPLRAIRAFCVECSGGNAAEARKCTAVTCPLWPMRMGKNPFHAKAVSHE